MKTIRQLTSSRCKSESELRERMTLLECAMFQYDEAKGDPIPESQLRYNILNIVPMKIFELWQVQLDFKKWTSADIKERIIEILDIQYENGLEGTGIKHSLFNVEEDETACNMCSDNTNTCMHTCCNQTVNQLWGYCSQYDTEVDLIQHVAQGFTGYDEDGNMATEHTIGAIVQ